MKPIEPVTDFQNLHEVSGWLSPTGHFYSCKHAHHVYLAMKICEQEKIEFDEDSLFTEDSMERALEKLGWIKILTSGAILNKVKLGYDKWEKIIATPEQIITLRKISDIDEKWNKYIIRGSLDFFRVNFERICREQLENA